MNKQFQYIFALVTFFLCNVSIAQPVDSRIFVLPGFEGHEPKISSLFQNFQGYILVGTTNGLFRFDGIDFIKYDQPDNSTKTITAICEVNNEMWIGYDNGTIALLKNNRIVSLRLAEGFPKVAIKKIIADDRGIVWIATADEGVYYYYRNKLSNINKDDGLSDNYVYDIVFNSSAGIIAATDRGMNIIKLDKGKKLIKSFTSKDGLPDNIVRCLYSSSETSVWFGMEDGGIGSCNTDFKMIDRSTSWSYGAVNDVVTTASQVFVATEENGLLVFERDYNNKIVSFSGDNVNLKKVSCLLRDREGNIWAAGDDKLMLSSGSKYEFIYSFQKQTAEKIHCLLYANDKNIWFNSQKGVMRLTKARGQWDRKEYTISNIENTDISTIYEDINGTIWIGTMGKGIIFLDPKTGKEKFFANNSLLANSNIISISGKNNTVWISSLEGTFSTHVPGSDSPVINYANNPGIGNKYIYNILEDSKGRIWFATDGNGIVMMQNGKFNSFDSIVHKAGNVAYRIVEDGFGNIWYSTFNRGLVKFDGKKFYNFSISDGLSDLNITGLALSKDHLAVLHRNRIDLINTLKGTVSYLDEEQGLYNINTDLNAYTSDADGNLYFIADTMLCKYHAFYSSSDQPKIMIDRIQLFLNDIHVQNNHKFSYDENNLSFYYTGLYYSAPGKIIYQYKLDGYDKDWIVTKDRVQNFPQLPHGTYTFRVRASLNNIFQSAPEATFTFTILKPFWQTAWFITLSILILASAVYFIVKAREIHFERMNRFEQEKIRSQLETLKSQINPHFLFNSFNTLISEIEENPSNAVIYVEKLSDFYRSIVSYREKDIIVLGEELQLLNNYSFIQQKRFGQAFQIKSAISAKQAREYYITPLALQLLIENAVKHNVVSVATPLLIELFINEEEYLVVRNNINKKMVEEKGNGLGLENIQKRYELLSPRALIIENNDKYFIVKIPLLINSYDKSINYRRRRSGSTQAE